MQFNSHLLGAVSKIKKQHVILLFEFYVFVYFDSSTHGEKQNFIKILILGFNRPGFNNANPGIRG